VALVIVVELDAGVSGQVERDVGAAGDGVEAVVLAPTVVERGFVLIAAGRHRVGALPDIIGRVVGQIGGGAVGLPIARTAQFLLQ
jgi:hypothetical protein